MLRNLKQIKYRVGLPIIALVFFLVSVIPAVYTSYYASAATGSKNDIDQRVFAFQAYVTMSDGSCVWEDSGIFTDASTWMQTSWSSQRNKNVPVGTVFNRQVARTGGEGDINCDNMNGWVDKAVTVWGFASTKEFLDKLVTNGGLTFNNGEYSKVGDKEIEAAIKKTLQATTFFSGSDLGALSKDEFYYDALINFQDTCSVSFSSSDAKLNGDDRVSAKTKKVEADGTVTEGYWHFSGKGTKSVGTALKPGEGTADCEELASMVSRAEYVDAYIKYVKDGGTPPSDGSTGSGPGAGTACTQIINPLTWILCPILDLADGLYGVFTSFIQSMLTVQESLYDSEQLKASWAAMRNIASSLIVIVALIMIASQVFNFDFLSAYTIKKVLPRLIIAAIAIQLSWFIFTTIITVINAIGLGIYSLMLAPFGLNGGGGDIVDLLGTQSEGAKLFSGTLIAVGAGAGFIAVGGLAGIVAAAIAVGFALVMAVATLILRKMLIIALLVLAPLALVAWILPGTQKYWTTWWNLFIRLLFMFPLIMILIASGKIFAALLAQSGAGYAVEQGIKPLIIIIAYFIPLFLIPATFKFAGGIFATVSGKMSSFGKQWGKQSGDLAKGKTIESVGRLARNRNNRFTRGLNYASHGAVTSRQRSRAAETSRAAIHEREKNFQALVEARTAGMDRGRKHAELLDIINNGSEDMAEGAARILAAERGWNQMDNLNARGLHRVREIAANDPTGFGSSLWSSRRDIADGPADRISTMSANDAAGQHSSFFTAGNVNQLDPRTAADLTRNQTLMSALNADTQELIYQRAGIPNPIAGGGGNPARGGAPAPAAGGGGAPAGGNPAAGGGNRGQAGGNTPPRVINLTQGTTGAGTTGAATMLHTASNVQTQINNAGGMSSLSSEEVIDIYNHADRNWRNDTEGTQIGLDAIDELRNRGILPPSNNGPTTGP
ncbi:MAG: hypothetical protein U0491_00935 [Candidatus Saccharimonadales bacterium]